MNLGTPSFVLAAIAILPLFCPAQKFQEPTKEELQMTSDPKAPGAPAVYLYREDDTDLGSLYVSQYARIKVLTEEGKAWSRVEVVYDPAVTLPPTIEGRTIHPDGTVSAMQHPAVHPQFTDESLAKLQTEVFVLPEVTVGSILEYRWTLRIAPSSYRPPKLGDYFTDPHRWTPHKLLAPRWAVQERIYTHHAKFRFAPRDNFDKTDDSLNSHETWQVGYVDGERSNYLGHVDRLPTGVKVTQMLDGKFTLELQDVSALSSEANAPPDASRAYYVQFYHSPVPTPSSYWPSEIKRWSNELESATTRTTTLQQASSALTAGASTSNEKALKLYDAVQELQNEDFVPGANPSSRTTWFQAQPKKPDEVWKRKSGTATEIARLYLALCKAAGLDAYGISVANRERRIFDPNYLSLEQLNALLIVVRIDGKDEYLDPGEKLCPFGKLAWNHTLSDGISQNSKDFIHTPAGSVKDAIAASTAELFIDPVGNAKGAMTIQMSGPEALYWRQMNLVAGAAETQRQFGRFLEDSLPAGAKAEAIQFKGLEAAAGFLEATVQINGPFGSASAGHIALPAFLFSRRLRDKFVEQNRISPVDLRFPEQVIDDVKYRLPEGYSVVHAPAPAQIAWPEHAALVITTTTALGTVEIKRVFARAFVVADAKEYRELRDYYRKLEANDQQQVLLAPSSAAGN